MSEERIIGIDLGTTNTVVAIVVGNEPEVIPNTEGSNKTPSVVAFLENNEVVVGEIARRQAATNSLRTITSVKRLMGRSYADVTEAGDRFPYKLVNHEGELLIDIDHMGYRPEQVSALIVKKVKESAEAWLDEEVKKAYRRMAIKYHPDKISHLGEDAQKGATEKFQKVQQAYEQIKKHRKMK